MARRSRVSGANTAVVVALDCITGLQTARILAARGIPVVGLAADRHHFCARTRVVREVIEGPTSGDGLIAELERLGPRLGGSAAAGPAVLVPCSDQSVLAISAARERLAEWYRFVLPAHDTVELLMDKVRFAEHAEAHGLAIPPTRILRDRADAAAAATELRYPAVIKPGLKSARWQAATRAKVFRVENPTELLAAYERCSAWADVLIAQSWVEGSESDLYSSNVYFDRASQPQVTFVARKIRQWPVETGTSCLGEEVRNDAVLDESIRLFESVGYQGLGYLELKRDARSGRHFIIEPNIGRPTGRSAIAERGGVELLLTAYRDALGQPLPTARTQRYGSVKWIYWRHDLQAAVIAARHGRLSPLGWWRSVRGPKVEAVGSWRDPLPFLVDGWATLAAIGGRRRRGKQAPRPTPGTAPGDA
ncbi:MAG: carboxylate--amine ligase [Chloroflexota bacterium]|nr:carboxylate--amine ligase [Chloroflexota bacterium]